MTSVFQFWFSWFTALYSWCLQSYITSFFLVCGFITLALNIFVKVMGKNK